MEYEASGSPRCCLRCHTMYIVSILEFIPSTTRRNINALNIESFILIISNANNSMTNEIRHEQSRDGKNAVPNEKFGCQFASSGYQMLLLRRARPSEGRCVAY